MRSGLITRRPASAEWGRWSTWAVGVGTILVALSFLYVGLIASDHVPGRAYYMLHAEFRDAGDLTLHAPVAIAGRQVGQVTGRRRTAAGLSVVDLQIAADDGPLRADTTARARPRTPLGDPLVDLVPGAHGRPLASGALIPVAQTTTSVALDDVLSAFDARTRRSAQRILRELGTGFAGRGGMLNETVGDAPALLRDSTAVAGAVNGLDGAARRLLPATDRALAALDPVRGDLATGLRDEAGALKPLAARAAAVRSALASAPPTLSTLETQLTPTDAALAEVAGLAADLRPALRSAPAGIGRVSNSLRSLARPLAALPASLARIRRAVPPVLSALDTARPAIPAVRFALAHLQPLTDELGPRGCDIALFAERWRSMQEFGTRPEGPLGPRTAFRLELEPSAAESVFNRSTRSPAILSNPYPKPCEAGKELSGR